MFFELVLTPLTKEIKTSELRTILLQVSVVAINQLNKVICFIILLQVIMYLYYNPEILAILEDAWRERQRDCALHPRYGLLHRPPRQEDLWPLPSHTGQLRK